MNNAHGSQLKDAITADKGKILPDNKLIEYALEKINQDRSQLGLSALNLSKNNAAQNHADELFQSKDKQPTHLSKTGMKPYMVYSIYGGRGYMEQNVAIAGYDNQKIIMCEELPCQKINPYKEISKSEWNMIANDTLCCNDSHKKNILDPHHTAVSIGIAYDNYYFALVQNFENNYLLLDPPMTLENKHIQIAGRIEPFNKSYAIDSIGVYFDAPPSSLLYEQNKYMNKYTLGNLVGAVVKPAPLFYQYEKPMNYTLIQARTWNQDNKMINIEADLSSIITKHGVYTLVTYLKNDKLRFPVGSYSIFS